ncbi:hypothetical protein BCR37DRAFT_123533 [Protomyces lactucae-debilis]|uniref:HECT-type E3 ubiquitin transferase n=1 Tax=Protomyces lactucae-debilis TaxID=2754530 RepID=A0A1Y2FRZ0_PROLT|nr:uncharacterized protein BCR37DRAFT_123533 [Protomyces lactucae-debilis]ORY86772.1 hypothetical protein BCR37DRAFT_123533 [Protomyces lactucae-debilis]
MRVIKKMARRALQAPPAVRSFMDQVMAAQEHELAPILQSFNKWTFPKGDLFQWVAVLDRCDAILEAKCRKYALEKVQVKSFEEDDRQLLVAILAFTAFLLDHCANRSLYSSANNITELLNTTDIDVCEQTCRVTVRLAHRHNQQRNSRHPFGISSERILRLATSLQSATKDCGAIHIPMGKLLYDQAPLPEAWRSVHYWFYKQATENKQSADQQKGDYFTLKTPSAALRQPQAVPSTPTPGHGARSRLTQTPNTPATPGEALGSHIERTGEGLELIHLPAETLQAHSIEELLQKAIEDHTLPVSHHFEFMVRLRLAKTANESRDRLSQLVSIRALALAALAYTVAEPVLQTRIFTTDGEVVQQLASLTNPDYKCSEQVKISALIALEAIAHHRPKLNDVLAVLGASVNHGLIIYIVKRVLADLRHDVPKCSSEYVEAVSGLLHYLSTTQIAGTMLCSAGLVQLLIQLLENQQPAALRAVVKSLALLDHLLYGFQQSFQIFCAANGPAILVERIRTEVLHDIEAAPGYEEACRVAKVDYRMPHERFSLLKTMLKTLLHMMQSSGTSDGLRNLIESPLLDSINLIYGNVNIFGSSVFATATNIMSTFIHNEPTSYAILHEKKVPESFLNSITNTILPASDALGAIPNALGAICLNAQGLTLFKSYNVIDAFFNIFTEQKHCEALQDSDTAGILGGAIDEFIRHHPHMKVEVQTHVFNTAQRIKRLGQRCVDTTDFACFVREEGKAHTESTDAITATVEDDDHMKRSVITLYIDIIARFLEGFFNTASHAADFVNKGGVHVLITYYELDCLPYDFARSSAALALSHVFRITSEVDARATLLPIYASMRKAVQDCGEMPGPHPTDSKYAVQRSQGFTAEQTPIVALRRCHSYAVLLSDLYALPVFGHGRSALPFYTEFQSGFAGDDVLQLLGQFHRKLVWEEIKLSNEMELDWVKATQPQDEGPAQPVNQAEAEKILPEQVRMTDSFKNLKMLRFLLCQIPPCIIPFYQGLSKMLFTSRRPVDGNHGMISYRVAVIIAQIMEEHLTFEPTWTQSDRIPYAILMVTNVQMILCDDRNPANLTVSVLMHFDAGVHKLKDLLVSLWQELRNRNFTMADLLKEDVDLGEGSVSEATRSLRDARRLHAAIELILRLFLQFTSHHAVLDSPQTQAIAKSRDPLPGDPFNANALLRKLRGLILPTMAELFEDENRANLSSGVFKIIVQIMTQCMAAEGEKSASRTEIADRHTSFLSVAAPLGAAAVSHPSPVQREQNVSRLMALGYARHVASSALTEANENVQSAMDFLVAHPQMAAITSNDADRHEEDSPIDAESTDTLDTVRQNLDSLILGSVAALEHHPDVVFELSALILASMAVSKTNEWLSDGVSILIGTLESMVEDAAEPRKAAHLGAITHLLAKLSHSVMFMQKCSEDLIESEETIRSLLADTSDVQAKPWVASAILILDAMVAQSDGPHAVSPDGSTPAGLSQEQVEQIFTSCFALLKSRPSDKGTLLSLCRFFVRLTRRKELSARFIQEGGLQELFAMLKPVVSQTDENIRITFVILLRHLIESEDIITSVMEREIKSWFTQPKTRNTEISNFVKQNASVALRDPDIFVKATQRLCCFPKYDESANLQAIALRSLAYADTPAYLPEDKEVTASSNKPVEVIQSLLTEMQSSRERFQTEQERDTKAIFEGSEAKKVPFKSSEHPEYLYRCLLLQCLTELLASYTPCKLEFINYSRKPSKDATTPAKPRTAILNFLVLDLLSNASIHVLDDIPSKKRYAIENWTRAVLVSLCASVTPPDDGKDETLQHVRKIVLDVLTKVIRDTIVSQEPADSRYAKIISLAELLYRLMTSNAITQAPQNNIVQPPPESQWHTAKLMIEKDYVSLLSSILADVDLQHPSARRVVKCVLKPLKTLSKISVRLSETTDLVKPIADQGATDGQTSEANFFEESSSESSNAEGEEGREDTPDLYRNSALGLFGGDMQEESEHSSYMSGEDDEMYDEMDYDDEGSETGSAVSDEELELAEGHPGGHDMDVELILDGEHMGHDGDDSGSDGEHSSDYSDEYSDSMDAEEIEIIEEQGFDEGEWQDEEDDGDDIVGDQSVPGDALLIDLTNGMLGGPADANENEMDGGHPDDIDDDEEDYDEGMSQDEDLIDDDNDDDGDQWGWAGEDDDGNEDSQATQRQTAGRNIAHRLWASLGGGGAGGIARNGFDPDVQVFRRPRVGGPAGQPPATEQSLLSNPLLTSNARNAIGGRTDGQPRNEVFSDWVESIEALMGGGAVQLIGDMLQGPNARRAQAIRVEVNGAGEPTVITAGLERALQETNLASRLAGDGHASGTGLGQTGSTRTEEDPMLAISFDPSSTLKRWRDDTTITFDGASVELALRLVGRLLQVMSPQAKTEAAERKVVEERLRLERMRIAEEERTKRDQEQQAKQAEEQLRKKEQERNQPAPITAESNATAPMITEASDSMEGVEPTEQTSTSEAPRQFISIRGQNVDITGLGIDVEFLNALPEEMREEVLTQHIRERRAAAQENLQQAVELTPEFLEALPAEIRAELIQQETIDRRRRERLARQAQAQAASGAPAGPTEMDPASFLASLDPALRQQVLMDMDQDDDLFSTLPPHLLAELGQRRATPRDMERIQGSRGAHDQATSGPVGTGDKADENSTAAPKVKREAIQLLDKNGISGLLRLIFLPLPQQKNFLHEVLLNLCENRHNRAEIIGHLLLVLQDGTADIQGAERCFNMMTKRSRLSTTETPMKTPKKAPSALQSLPLIIGDNAPSLVALQVLQALAYLVHYNAQLPSFFLTEHDSLAARRSAKAKGKGKESLSKANKFPINSLVGLLDREVILETAEVLEQLSHLLGVVTRPLLMLKKRQKLETQQSENVEMTLIEAAPAEAANSIVPAGGDSSESKPADSGEKPKSKKTLVPPEIPVEHLRLVVNILRANECSSKTFQNTLATMQHLGALPGAKEVIADELVNQAQTLGMEIQGQLLALLGHIRPLQTDEELQASSFAAFSSSSSSQAKLLRMLKSIDYLFETRNGDQPDASADQANFVAQIYDSLNFGQLWSELSECLTIIHEKSNMVHVATILLPLIEALMVVCKQIAAGQGSTKDPKTTPSSRQATPASSESLATQFFSFTEQHRKILNQMVRNNPALMSGSFSLLVKNPKVLEFDNKRNYFVRKLRDRAAKEHYRPLALNVRRDMIFLDSYKNLHFKSGDEIKYAKLNIRFAGEEGVDAGGVTREWFQVLARQMFDPNYALFVPVNADRNTYHPNKLSGINPEHLSFFKFVGRIVGKALYDGRLLDCHFSRPVYRKMLGKNVSLKDMETLDLEYYKSLLWMLENDITDVITETFSVERDDFGEVTIIDLIPNGREIPVTEENKQEYVARVTQYRLLDSVSEQLDHFMKGFNDIISPELVSIFNEQELELLISGLPDIDADDWRNNTEYHNYTAASPQIQWFWRAVRSFDDEERARLLQFATGSSRIPIEGFANLEGMQGVQKFNIHRDYTNGDRLPQSHTCFNQLDLPEYESYEALRNSLLTAISEGNEGFGFA